MRLAVVGAESSGTRLIARILSGTGADALHRSFPYGGDGPRDPRRWPEEDVVKFHPYAVIWMMRDWWATARSQVNANHVNSIEEAWYNIGCTTLRIADMCSKNNYRYFVVNYESLVQRPEIVVANLTDSLKLRMPTLENIIDGNIKYLET